MLGIGLASLAFTLFGENSDSTDEEDAELSGRSRLASREFVFSFSTEGLPTLGVPFGVLGRPVHRV